MSRTFRNLVVFALSMTVAPAAFASSFNCSVVSAHAVADTGQVVTDTEHLQSQVGSTFTVNQETGTIAGGYFINNAHSRSIDVVNEPQNNSLYVISRSHGPHEMVGYLYIGKHRSASTKPFIYTSSGEYIFTGFCAGGT